jgi:hypothetical protein
MDKEDMNEAAQAGTTMVAKTTFSSDKGGAAAGRDIIGNVIVPNEVNPYPTLPF